MIDPSMDRLVGYLMKLRGEQENPMMPPQAPQQDMNPAVAQILQMVQGQQQQESPVLAGGLAGLENSAVDPESAPVRLPSGVITNDQLPGYSKDQSQPVKPFDPNYDWTQDNNGNVRWKPKGAKNWVDYRRS